MDTPFAPLCFCVKHQDKCDTLTAYIKGSILEMFVKTFALSSKLLNVLIQTVFPEVEYPCGHCLWILIFTCPSLAQYCKKSPDKKKKPMCVNQWNWCCYPVKPCGHLTSWKELHPALDTSDALLHLIGLFTNISEHSVMCRYAEVGGEGIVVDLEGIHSLVFRQREVVVCSVLVLEN